MLYAKTEPEPYLFSYAFTKKALLIGQRAYCEEFGFEASSLVLPTVYGVRGDFSETSHVIGALIGKFARAKKDNLPSVEVWGDGSQVREFIHVDDVVDALLLVAERPIGTDVMNLGTSVGVSVGRLADLIRGIVGYEGAVDYNTDRFVGAAARVLDSSKFLRETGWRPRVPLEVGLRKVIEAYAIQIDGC